MTHRQVTLDGYHELFDRLQEFIDQEYSNPELSTQHFSDKHHVSRRQLQRVLSFYETSWRDQLLRARMRNAEYLLVYTNETVNQILQRVGYKGNSSFHKRFQERHGITPMEYRSKHRHRSQNA